MSFDNNGIRHIRAYNVTLIYNLNSYFAFQKITMLVPFDNNGIRHIRAYKVTLIYNLNSYFAFQKTTITCIVC